MNRSHTCFASQGFSQALALPPGAVDRYLALDVGGPEDGPLRDIVLRAALPEADMVYGEGAERGSEALVRLDFGEGALPGLLAFWAAEPDRFAPDQASDLVAFYGAVVARVLRRWLAA